MLHSKPKRTFHTLHRRVDRLPFVVHITQRDETSKTTLLAFLQRKDALLMGNVFEAYHRQNGMYPPNHFTYERPLEITFENSEEQVDFTAPLSDLAIEETDEEDLCTFCANQYMDIMLIHDLDGKARLQIITFETPMDLFRIKFEETFKE
jgi:hypothetical protein